MRIGTRFFLFFSVMLLGWPVFDGNVLLAQSPAVTQLRYRVKLMIDPQKKTMAGEERILLTPVRQGREIRLDAQEMTVLEVRARRGLADWRQDKQHLSLTFKENFPAGKPLALTVRYRGDPRDGVSWEGGGVQALYDTPHWMPCVMEPAALARFELEAHLPAAMTIAASGTLVRERVRGAQKISQWRQSAPVPPFVLGFVAGNLHETRWRAEGVELRGLSEKHAPEQMQRIFARTPDALRFFTDRAGVALVPAVYTQALVSGAPMQEMAQMTALPVDYGDTLLTEDPSDVSLMAHELAHQWWGIRVPCADWDDFWLNEGMANFMADAYIEHAFGEPAYRKAVDVHREIYQKGKATGKDHALCFHAWKWPAEAGGWVAYHKGAYVLELLREQMGEDAFWRGLRTYTMHHQGRPVTSRELQTEMEQACGHSLQSFFDQWVYA